MIIIDMNQIALASLMMNLNMNKSKEVDESMVRHMILNSIRMYRHEYKHEYGEVVLTWDSKHSWRRDYFPQYKAGRGKGREKSSLDWDSIFQFLNKVKSSGLASPKVLVMSKAADLPDINPIRPP